MTYTPLGPSHGDPDFVALRESWNPGDSHGQTGLRAHMSRDTRLLHLYPRPALPRTLWMFLSESIPRVQLECCTSGPFLPQTRAWPSFPDSHVPLGLGQEQDKGFWHKKLPAGGMKSVLGLVNRPCKADRGSEAGPGPASLKGQREWRWGAGRARNTVFLSKTLQGLGLDFQPGVYSICSRVHDRV